MSKLFGTDGIRGVAGKPPLDVSTISRISHCLIRLGHRSFVIGRDTRTSGPWIEEILTQSLSQLGAQVHSVGVLPTPAISFMCRELEFDTGVIISASHNIFSDNGLKIFAGNGLKLSRDKENEIKVLLDSDEETCLPDYQQPSLQNQSDLIWTDLNALSKYSSFLRSTLSVETLHPLKVVLDCASGAAFQLAPQIFRQLGARVVALNTNPDGTNINRNCGAVHPQQLARTVVEEQADFGVAFDGDSDRSIFSDHRGQILSGEHTLYVLSCYLLKSNCLHTHRIVTTTMSNMGLDIALANLGIDVTRTQVGDRNVIEAMLEKGHALGGEPSGHIVLLDHCPAGDGILTALKIAEILLAEKRSLAGLGDALRLYPQVVRNVPVRKKEDLSRIPEINKQIELAQKSISGKGRVLVRYSGTELLLRIMVEGKDRVQVEHYAERIANQAQRHLS